MLMKYAYLFLFIITISSCKTGNAEKSADNSNTTIASKAVVWDSSSAFFIDSTIQLNQLDTLQTPHYRNDKHGFIGKLLLSGQYHGDEITEEMKAAKWYKLFLKSNEYHIEQSIIEFKKVFDPIVDDDSTKPTGIKVPGEIGEYVYMANIEGLDTGVVESVKLDTNIIVPGHSLYFEMDNASYRLYASAYYWQQEGRKDIGQIANYKVYLERDIRGAKTKQLILARPFYDGMYLLGEVKFVGDIDGDKKPDFVIDTSNHYNGTTPTLYLSSYADKDQLVKAIAYHQAVGC